MIRSCFFPISLLKATEYCYFFREVVLGQSQDTQASVWQCSNRLAAILSSNIQTAIVLVSWGCKSEFPIASKSGAAARHVKGCLCEFRAAVKLVPVSLQAVGLTERDGGCLKPLKAPLWLGAAMDPAGIQQGKEGLPSSGQLSSSISSRPGTSPAPW